MYECRGQENSKSAICISSCKFIISSTSGWVAGDGRVEGADLSAEGSDVGLDGGNVTLGQRVGEGGDGESSGEEEASELHVGVGV